MMRIPAWVYLSLLLCAPVAYWFALWALDPLHVMAGSIAPSLLLAVMAAAAVTAILAAPDGRWNRMTVAWLALVGCYWLYLVLVTSLRGGASELEAAYVPVTLILIGWRSMGRSLVQRAADVLMIAIVVTGLLQLALEVSGLIPSWYAVKGGTFIDLAAWDRDSHWFQLGHLLGLDGRWGGALGDPNLVGPVSSVVVVYGLARRGALRAVLVVGGLLGVVLADSRAAYAALAVGAALLVLLPQRTRLPRMSTRARILGGAVAGLALARLAWDLVRTTDSTLAMTGRVEMWPDFLSLLHESPVIGVGTARILAAVDAGQLPPWAAHGHDLAVDTIVRYGWVGLGLLTAVLAAAAVNSGWAARRDGLPLALLVALLVNAVANVLLDWRFPSVPLSLIVVAVLLAAPRQVATDGAVDDAREAA